MLLLPKVTGVRDSITPYTYRPSDWARTEGSPFAAAGCGTASSTAVGAAPPPFTAVTAVFRAGAFFAGAFLVVVGLIFSPQQFGGSGQELLYFNGLEHDPDVLALGLVCRLFRGIAGQEGGGHAGITFSCRSNHFKAGVLLFQ